MTTNVKGTVSSYAATKAEAARQREAAARYQASRLARRGVLDMIVPGRRRRRDDALFAAAHAADEARQEAGRLNAGVDAEQRVVDALASAGHQVICGLDLGPPIGDVDVLVPDAGALVEVKAGGGVLASAGDGSVTHGERPSPGFPLAQAAKQAHALVDGGVVLTPIVCYPNAQPSCSLHAETRAWLVGGTEVLVDLLDRLACPPTTSTRLVDAAQAHLRARKEKLSGQIRTGKARIAKWDSTIQRSGGWSKGPEIRANLGQRSADVGRQIAGWQAALDRLDASEKANKRLR